MRLHAPIDVQVVYDNIYPSFAAYKSISVNKVLILPNTSEM